MNTVIILIAIFLTFVMLLVCEIHYQIYRNYGKTSDIAGVWAAVIFVIIIIGVVL